jgi:hypothetical protein
VLVRRRVQVLLERGLLPERVQQRRVPVPVRALLLELPGSLQVQRLAQVQVVPSLLRVQW